MSQDSPESPLAQKLASSSWQYKEAKIFQLSPNQFTVEHPHFSAPLNFEIPSVFSSHEEEKSWIECRLDLLLNEGFCIGFSMKSAGHAVRAGFV